MAPFIIAGSACLLGALIMALTIRPRPVLQPTPAVAGRALVGETTSAS
jgi:hypothetical protein